MPQNQQPTKFKAIGWIFALFFSTFIIVDIFYIVIAEKTWRGLATEDGYQKGLKYNQTIDAVKKQKDLGWNFQINYQPKSSKVANLQIKLLDKNNQEIKDAKIVANIKRPVQEGLDFTVELNLAYNSLINFPLIGQWDIEIIARKNDEVYQNVKRVVVR